MNSSEMSIDRLPDRLRIFLPKSQQAVLDEALRGEEKAHFIEIVRQLDNRIQTMPKTYEQDGSGDQAKAYLHYFHGSHDWYIIEKDVGSPNDGPGGNRQQQAFGLAVIDIAELGYISIEELVANGVELDFYFEPTSLDEIKKNLDHRQAVRTFNQTDESLG